jgi:hypothetical protein
MESRKRGEVPAEEIKKAGRGGGPQPANGFPEQGSGLFSRFGDEEDFLCYGLRVQQGGETG